MSVILNSTAGVILEDIVRGCFKLRPSEKNAYMIVKGSILLLGISSMLCVFIIEKLGGILELATSLSAIASGTTFGVFTLGMLVPWSNNYGAIFGALAGAIMSGWIAFGTQAAIASGLVVPHRLSISTEGCLNETLHKNFTGIIQPTYPDESDVFPLYRLSFHWINPIGIISVLVVGTIVSYLSGPRDLRKIDPELISPVIYRLAKTI